ncbi:HEAT repeat domain-containing protein [Myxococcus landrumensis]|uniref:HEAT repeat domain-containing protein n=1 Tax=Myxococcus landrumensis TaxID=2813577 RepID=A0ABX7MZV5_9BACT|nr:HEAT repeat domain-containing protein [Myxococcus landrumus]QSQ11960.1 HEAT repeat domain-containing protein [Myxococcus landrumus]
MSPRLKSLLTLFAVLVMVSLWSIELPDEPPVLPAPPPELPVPEVPQAPVLQGVKGRHRVLTPGLEHRYHFDLDTRTAEQLPGAEAGRSWRQFGWSGTLELTYVGLEGERHFFAGRLSLTRVEENGLPDEASLRELGTALEQPVYLAQDLRGRILTVYSDATLKHRARHLVSLLLSTTQFVAEDGRSWSTEETDTTGDFESEYRAGGSANTYVKTQRRYLRTALPLWAPLGPRGPGLMVPRLRGHLDFTLDEEGLVREVTGSEVVETGGGALGLPLLRTETRVALTRWDSRQGPPLSMVAFRETRARLGAEPLSASQSTVTPERDRLLVGDATLEELIHALEDTPREDESVHVLLRERLSALLRWKPSSAKDAARWFRSRLLDDAVASDVLDALGDAGTPEAQHALASLLLPSRRDAHLRALSAAGRVGRPTVELALALTRALESARKPELRHAAMMALGTVARNLERFEPGHALDLVEDLLKHCEARPLDVEPCLRAMARMGSPRSLAYASTARSHPSPHIRAAATEALGAIDGADVDVLLDTVLLEDTDALVREKAAEVISRRVAAPHLRAATQALRTEPVAQVRAQVVRMLGPLPTMEPLVLELLRDVASSDGSEDVRRLASSFLAR